MSSYGRVRINRLVRYTVAALLCSAAACKQAQSKSSPGEVSRTWQPTQAGAIAGVSMDDIRAQIQRQLAGQRPREISVDRWHHVRNLYQAFNGGALWMDTDGPNKPRTNALLRAIVNANDDALRVDAYPLGELVQAISTVRSTKTPTASQLADADVLLTTTYISLAEDLLSGQNDPQQLSQDWHIARGHERIDSAASLSLRIANLDEGLARMRPQYDDYALLQKALSHFRDIVKNGGWQPVPGGKLLKRGMRDSPARLAALRARLAAEDSVADPDSSSGKVPVYDAALAGAVADFQAHHGIVVDSMLGGETLQSLNVPADYRLAQIAANLERLRWLPRDPGHRYVLVNVPAFRLEAYDSGQKVLEMKVIVGEEFEGKKTPVFADSMETVVFRPYWDITPDIQRKEIEPKVAADPCTSSKRHGVLQGRRRDANSAAPGRQNSLGLVKFLFPNDFNIYLHDTPEGQLFDKDVRAFSHGCIRAREAGRAGAVGARLADRSRATRRCTTGRTTTACSVPKKIPVYIVYLTTYARDGSLYFGNDLYGPRRRSSCSRSPPGRSRVPRSPRTSRPSSGW